MNFLLMFKDPQDKAKFDSSKTTTFRFLNSVVVHLLLFVQVGELYFRILNDAEDTTKTLPLMILIPIILSLLLLLGLRFPQLSENFIALSILFLNIALIELVCQNAHADAKRSPLMNINIGTNIEMSGILLILTKLHWQPTVIILAVVNIYNRLRIHDASAYFSLTFFLCQIFFVFGLIYRNEKEDKKKFLAHEKAKSLLETFEGIVTKATRNVVIFMRDDEASFYNDLAKKELELSTQHSFAEFLRTIKVIKRGGIKEFMQMMADQSKTNLPEQPSSLYEAYKHCQSNNNDPMCAPIEHISLIGGIGNYGQEGARTFIINISSGFLENNKGILISLDEVSHIYQYYHTIDTQKDNLLATVSHDLRAPLNGIMGMLNLLLEEVDKESPKEKINTSLALAITMQSMICDILDFSLISKGKFKLKLDLLNLSSLVNETARVLSLQANKKGIELQVENYLTSSEENLKFDGNRLRQVLYNLIGNAIKYTKNGRVVIRIREESELPFADIQDEIRSKYSRNSSKILSSFENEMKLSNTSMSMLRRRFVFEVEDSGIGIKREDLGKLFKLFSRVTAGHDEKMTGIGLGLVISQRLVKLMNCGIKGAKIRVQSTYGSGSVFVFPLYIESNNSECFEENIDDNCRLPLFLTKGVKGDEKIECSTPDFASKSAEESNIFIQKRPKEKLKILIVDDDQVNLLVASKYLKTFEDEFSCQLATNGEQAIHTVLENASKGSYFDVVLMDCNMPFMDGFEATRQLKAMMKEGKIRRAIIVGLTGYSSESDFKRCTDAGMDCVLSKPYSKTELVKKIQDAIKKKSFL